MTPPNERKITPDTHTIIATRAPVELAARFRALCESEERTLSQGLRLAIRAQLATNEAAGHVSDLEEPTAA
jgi:hypothetical protein